MLLTLNVSKVQIVTGLGMDRITITLDEGVALKVNHERYTPREEAFFKLEVSPNQGVEAVRALGIDEYEIIEARTGKSTIVKES